jgi:hypothetical protein
LNEEPTSHYSHYISQPEPNNNNNNKARLISNSDGQLSLSIAKQQPATTSDNNNLVSPNNQQFVNNNHLPAWTGSGRHKLGDNTYSTPNNNTSHSVNLTKQPGDGQYVTVAGSRVPGSEMLSQGQSNTRIATARTQNVQEQENNQGLAITRLGPVFARNSLQRVVQEEPVSRLQRVGQEEPVSQNIKSCSPILPMKLSQVNYYF